MQMFSSQCKRQWVRQGNVAGSPPGLEWLPPPSQPRVWQAPHLDEGETANNAAMRLVPAPCFVRNVGIFATTCRLDGMNCHKCEVLRRSVCASLSIQPLTGSLARLPVYA